LKRSEKKKNIMSNTSKMVMWLLIVLIVVAGIVWFAMGNKNAIAPSAPGYSGTPASPATETTAPSTAQALPTPPTDDSNAAITQDLTVINSQVSGLATDSASIDQGLNDQPVTQGE
jgi:hypothetical protein